MHISQAKFDEASGNPIVKGNISISGDPNAIPAHDYLLLSLIPPDENARIRLCPVTEIAPASRGFYKTSVVKQRSFFLPLSLKEITDLCTMEGEPASLFKKYRFGAGSHFTKDYTITEITATASYGEEGISLSLTGTMLHESSIDGLTFGAEAVIRWEQMTLLGFSRCPDWKFCPGAREMGLEKDISKQPHEIKDLLVAGGLCWPILKGSLEVFSTEHHAYPLVPFKMNFIEITNIGYRLSNASSARLSLSDAILMRPHRNGFMQTRGSNYWISLGAIGRDDLKAVVSQEKDRHLSISGNGLGRLTYKTNYAMEYGDPLGRISQDINKLVCDIRLHASGLTLTVAAELDDFDPEIFEIHKRERHSNLQPYERFDMEVTFPWSLLMIHQIASAWQVEAISKKS